MRIAYGTNSTITSDGVTVSNGYLTADMLGFGLQLMGCATLMANYTGTRNGRFGSAMSYAYGMGIYANKVNRGLSPTPPGEAVLVPVPVHDSLRLPFPQSPYP